ncbi:MAG: SIR2 family protein, partial [Acidimicrobiia bacterium]|nr:SIR2 family protein [Acidimicrobiia bacterium]
MAGPALAHALLVEMNTSGYNVFGNAELTSRVLDVAESDELTLVIGAGASVEAGLPDWDELIRRLVTDVANQHGLGEDETSQFSSWTLAREGLRGASALAKVMLGDAFPERLRKALYERNDDPVPGEISRAVGRLTVQRLAGRCEVATTNYDGLLADAIRQELELVRASRKGLRVVRAAMDRPAADSELLVRHLHGVLLASGQPVGKIVLSDDDYFLMQDASAWQEEYFGQRLRASMCLFVGTSLTDPNLLRYLYRSPARLRHLALFARQQDRDTYDRVQPRVAELREKTATARWEAVGVRPIHLDFYSLSAQFLWEVVHRQAAGRAYEPLTKRLEAWEAALSGGVASRSSRSFHAQQERLQSILAELTSAASEVLSRAGHLGRKAERLGMALWLFEPTRNRLTNLASSDRIWCDPRTLVPVDVNWRSDFVAVQAFCSGSIVSASTADQAATRWNHVIGIPLFLRNDDIGRLPVGVVTLASTVTAHKSVLGRG